MVAPLGARVAQADVEFVGLQDEVARNSNGRKCATSAPAMGDLARITASRPLCWIQRCLHCLCQAGQNVVGPGKDGRDTSLYPHGVEAQAKIYRPISSYPIIFARVKIEPDQPPRRVSGSAANTTED